MDFVAGVDAFGAVAHEEMLVHLFAGDCFQHRDTILFGSTGVNCAFINNDISIFKYFAYGLTGFDEGSEVGAVVFVGGGWDGDDVDLCIGDVVYIV